MADDWQQVIWLKNGKQNQIFDNRTKLFLFIYDLQNWKLYPFI